MKADRPGEDGADGAPPSGWSAWKGGGYRGPPPWRRGVQPLYLVVSLLLVAGLLTFFLLVSRFRVL